MSIEAKASNSGFYAEEIDRALTEQLFGIKTFSILTADASHAIASVEIIEGQVYTVKLSTLGYQITSPPKDTVFDYIDSLLQSVSPQYEAKRHDLWVQKLSNIASARAGDAEEDI